MDNKYMVVLINTIEKVKEFVSITASLGANITAKSAKYIVDAKSIMGLFSLDLSTPIEIICDDEVNEDVWFDLKRFEVGK